MKNYFILSIALIGLFASCKKSSSSSSSLTATVNGASKNFGNAALATKVSLGGITAIEILGLANTSTGESVDITITNALTGGVDSILAGVYSDTSTRFDVEVSYLVNKTSGTEYVGGTDVDGSYGPVSGTNHMVVTITSISKTAIKGTFSGNLYLNGLAGTPWPLTNGSFSVPLTQQ